jgi:hypothetical protein
MHLMPYYAKTGSSLPPNHLTSPITLLSTNNWAKNSHLDSELFCDPKKVLPISNNFYTDVMSVKNYVSK